MYYRKLEEKIKSCRFCKLRDSCESNIKYGPTYGYGGKEIIICGLAPSYMRKESKYPLSRDYDYHTAGMLFKVLDEIDWPIEKTYFTNLLKCSTPENRKPDKEEIDLCVNQWFSQELFLINPIGIISLGAYVNDYLQNMSWSIPIEICHVWHFSYIVRDPERYEKWKKDWKTAKEKMTLLKEFLVKNVTKLG